jgi:hypothetical protein
MPLIQTGASMVMPILNAIDGNTWEADFAPAIQSQAVTAIEEGQILLLPQLAFALLPNENKFLSPDYAHPKAKNISLNTHTGALRCGACSVEDHVNLKAMIQRFSNSAQQLVRQLLQPYANAIEVGRTSLRVVEISGRVSSYRKDDTRLHVDSFPATPNQGRRILRVFTNINPNGEDRVWRVGEPFETVAKRFLSLTSKQSKLQAALFKLLKITKSYRTEYDHIMLQIHDQMKADLHYQKTASQAEVRFAPNTSWIVQTDHVSHAAMAGQHVLEQTFYLPIHAMVNENLSPLRTLEKLAARKLV